MKALFIAGIQTDNIKQMNKGTYYFPRNRTYQPSITGSNQVTGTTCLPAYTGIDITSTGYTMPGEGVYLIVNNDASHDMTFPDATALDGHTVIIIPGSSTTVNLHGDIHGGYNNEPYGRIYCFVAISGSWKLDFF